MNLPSSSELSLCLSLPVMATQPSWQRPHSQSLHACFPSLLQLFVCFQIPGNLRCRIKSRNYGKESNREQIDSTNFLCECWVRDYWKEILTLPLTSILMGRWGMVIEWDKYSLKLDKPELKSHHFYLAPVIDEKSGGWKILTDLVNISLVKKEQCWNQNLAFCLDTVFSTFIHSTCIQWESTLGYVIAI